MTFSYGLRPNRGQYDALNAVSVGIMKRKVDCVLDADISRFFDTVEHYWLLKFIQHRIQDKRILRLINQWLKVGMLDEQGYRVAAIIGTQQEAVISPLLANIHLHYNFYLWLNRLRNHRAGDMFMVRYADDAVLGFQKHVDAVTCLRALTTRLSKFGLRS